MNISKEEFVLAWCLEYFTKILTALQSDELFNVLCEMTSLMVGRWKGLPRDFFSPSLWIRLTSWLWIPTGFSLIFGGQNKKASDPYFAARLEMNFLVQYWLHLWVHFGVVHVVCSDYPNISGGDELVSNDTGVSVS